MLKDLIVLANSLDSKGLRAEADTLDSIIQKLAQEAATHMCFVSGFSLMGQISIDIRCTKVETGEIVETWGTDSRKSENPVADAAAKVKEWKADYPGAKWGTSELQPPLRAEDLGL